MYRWPYIAWVAQLRQGVFGIMERIFADIVQVALAMMAEVEIRAVQASEAWAHDGRDPTIIAGNA